MMNKCLGDELAPAADGTIGELDFRIERRAVAFIIHRSSFIICP